MRTILILVAVFGLCAPAASQPPSDPAPRIAAQREAMARLSFLDGIWRGPAWSATREGRVELVQTERVGAFLDGAVRLIEGRGYNSDGGVAFNALGIISFDPDRRTYSLTSWAEGRSGVFPLRVTDDGFVWEIAAGPGVTIRYTATVSDGAWREIGERVLADGQPPLKFFEMTLRRVGDTDWPAGGPVPMR